MKKMQKNVLLIAAFVALWLGAYFALRKPEAAKPLPDLSGRSNALGLGAEYANVQKAVEFYRAEIRKNPGVVKNYVQLAQIFMQEARLTGRHHEYIPKAQELLSEARKRNAEDFEANATQAALLLTLHQFEQARTLAEKAIAQSPYNAFSQGVLVDALVELGDYEGAVRACDKMLSLRPDLRSYARAAYLRELHGDLRGAQQVMKMACDAGVSGQENRAWALYQLGKLYFNAGKLDTTEFIYRGIVRERPGYAHAMSGLAQILSARGDYAGAIDLLKQTYKDTPDHAFLEQLVEICTVAGQNQEAEKMTQLVLESYVQHEKEGWNVDLEYARFCSEYDFNLAEALQRAQREYQRRPNNIDVLEIYAWTLHQNGQSEKAAPLLQQAMRLKTQRASTYYRAGMIAKALHNTGKAQEYLAQALAMNPRFSCRDAQAARAALADLRQKHKLS
ncbi:MAG: tetratricopeptide repeat protein [bacterium]